MGSLVGTGLDEIQQDAVRPVQEATVALAMPGYVGGIFLADGERGGRPDFAGGLIAEIESLAGRVHYMVVRPRRNLILMAIERPGKASAGLRHQEAKIGISDHVDPRLGGAQTFAQKYGIFAAIIGKAATTVEVLHMRQGHNQAGIFRGAERPHGRKLRRLQ